MWAPTLCSTVVFILGMVHIFKTSHCWLLTNSSSWTMDSWISLYHKESLEGNQCKMFCDDKNIQVLKSILQDHSYPANIVESYSNALAAIREVYSSCGGKTLKPNWRDCTTNFKMCWTMLVKEKTVKLNMTPKAHQIGDHFEQYFEDPLVKPEGLGMCSDQIIEHMHSYIRRIMLKSRYLCSIADSGESAKRQHSVVS